MKKILVPVDFSKPSVTAMETACDIAKKGGARVIALHVVEEATSSSFKISGEGHPNDFEDRLFTYKMIQKASKQLEKLVQNPKFKDVRVDGEIRVGNPFHGMKTILTEQKVDLVVMGTQGHNSLEDMVIGSNTEKVVRHSKVPVLTVQKKPVNTKFKNIVYATSLEKGEEIFTRVIKTTQQIYNSTVHLVHINTPGDFQRDRVVKSYMEQYAKKMGLKNYTINVYNDVTTEEGIVYFAESINADLIAMATHGRTGFAHVMAGSIAEDVVSHSKRPVLTYVVKKR